MLNIGQPMGFINWRSIHLSGRSLFKLLGS